MHIDLDCARAAKNLAKAALAAIPGVVGIGISKIGRSYGLKVNLNKKLPPGVEVPKTIGGVPVKVEVVGTIRKRPHR
jgi:hypothetical protein